MTLLFKARYIFVKYPFTLNDLKVIVCEAVNFIPLTQKRDQRWAFVSMVMNFLFHKSKENISRVTHEISCYMRVC
jgi:hypothetical protein